MVHGEASGAREDGFTGRLMAESRGGGGEQARVLGEQLYDELREMARRRLRLEREDHTLQPTALVREAWMRLVDQSRFDWRGRAHFLALATQSMRCSTSSWRVDCPTSCGACRGAMDAGDPELDRPLLGLAEALADGGDHAQAEHPVLEASERLRSGKGEETTLETRARDRLRELYESWGRPEEAALWR